MVVEQLADVGKLTDNQHTESAARIDDFEVEILHEEALEVEFGDFEEQVVLLDGVGLVGQQQYEGCLEVVDKHHGGIHGGTVALAVERAAPHHAAVGGTGLYVTAFADAFHHHAGQRRHIAVGIGCRELFEGILESFHVTFLNIGEGMEEDELRHQVGERPVVVYPEVGLMHLFGTARQIVLVGPDVHGILSGHHVPEVPDIVGVGHGLGVGGLGESFHQFLPVDFRLLRPVHTHAHQIGGVPHIQPVGGFGITSLHIVECADGQREVLQFLVDDDTFVVKTFFDDGVAGILLFLCERQLGQIILAVVGILGLFEEGGVNGSRLCSGQSVFSRRVAGLCRHLGHSGGIFCQGNIRRSGVSGHCNGILHFLGGCQEAGGLVLAAPVVLGFACTPPALEFLFAPGDDRRVVEIPGFVLSADFRNGGACLGEGIHTCGLFVVVGLLFPGILGLFLLTFQVLDDGINSVIERIFRQGGQCEQAVLQMNGFGMGLQGIEHLREMFDGIVAGIGVLDDAHCRGITLLCPDIIGLPEGQLAQSQGCDGLVHAVPGALFQGTLVPRDGFGRILAGQFHVAEGKADLVEIFLVAGLPGEMTQLAFHLIEIVCRHHACGRNTGIELCLVVAGVACDAAVHFIGLTAMGLAFGGSFRLV